MSFLSGLGKIAGAALGSAGGPIGSLVGSKIAGAALSGVGSSVENAANQRQSYEYQRKLQQLSHQYAMEQLQKQQDFAASQSEIDRKWNSAPEQANRLREAGVNPFFALSGSQPSSVQSQSAGSASPVSAPSAPSSSNVGSQLGSQAMLRVAEEKQLETDSALKNSVKHLNETDALTRYAQNSAEIILSMKKAGLIDAQEARTRTEDTLKHLDVDYYRAIKDKRVESYNLDVDLKSLDKTFKQFNVKHLDERYALELAKTRSEISNMLASAEYFHESALSQPSLRYHLIMQGAQIAQVMERENMSPEQRKRFAEAMVKDLEERAKLAGAKGDTEFWKAFGGIIIGAASSIGIGGVIGKAGKLFKVFKSAKNAKNASKVIDTRSRDEVLFGSD